jgi:gliding motility-associated-like protein
MRYIISIWILLFFGSLEAQWSANWYLGEDTVLNFNANPPVFDYPGYNKYRKGGMFWRSCISNCKGKVVFYAKSPFVFNQYGDSIGNYMRDPANFSASSSVFVPNYFNDSVYYHFYVQSYSRKGGLYYSTLNAYANNGSVLKANLKITDSTDPANLCIVKNDAEKIFWVIVSYDCYTLYCYKVDKNGVSTTPVLNKGVFNLSRNKLLGLTSNIYVNTYEMGMPISTIVSSNKGNKIVSTSIPDFVNNSQGNAFIYDFDKSTGKISNGKCILAITDLAVNYSSLGACFSTDDSLTYLSITPSSNSPFTGTKDYKILQYNIVKNNRKTIRTSTNSFDAVATLSLGGNGKIYGFAATAYDVNAGGRVSIIENPNKIGTACKIYRPLDFPKVYKIVPSPTDHLINIRSNLEYANCVDSLRITWQGDSSFNKMTCRFGDGDSTIINSPQNKPYKLTHYYKTEGKYACVFEGRTKDCNMPVWYTDTLDFKFAPQSVLKKPAISQTAFCKNSKIQFLDTIIHSSIYQINWGDDSMQSIGISTSPAAIGLKHIYLKPGKYNIQITLSNTWGCSKVYNYPLTIKFLPQPNIGIITSAERCANRTFLLRNDSASATDTLQINYAGKINRILSNQSVAIKLLFNTDSIYLKETNTYGCFTLDTIAMKVLQGVNAQFTTQKNAYCMQQTDTAKRLFADPKDTSVWEWENAIYLHQKNLVFKAMQIGNHVLKHSLVNPSGCRDTQQQSIVVNPLPDASIGGIKIPVCTKEILHLFANSTSDSFFWCVNQQLKRKASTYDFQPGDSGNYTIKLTVISNKGCIDSGKSSIQYLLSPLAKYTVNDSNICTGDVLQFTFTGKADSAIWHLNGKQNTGMNWNEKFTAAEGEYALNLIAQNANGCKDTTNGKIQVENYPVADFTYNVGCVGVPIVFTDKSTGKIITHFWQVANKNGGGIVFKDTFLLAGNYTAKETVSTAFSCSDSLTKTVKIYALPNPQIYYTGTEYNAPDQYQYLFEPRPDTFVKYLWNFGSAGSSSKAKNYIVFNQVDKAEKIHLEVTDKNNCTGLADTIIIIRGLTLYLFPNSFTPNGDGINDGFGIAGPEYVKTYKLWIFNRWGENVFYTEDPYEKWVPQNPIPGEYIYKAKVQDIYSRWKEAKGIVVLIR